MNKLTTGITTLLFLLLLSACATHQSQTVVASGSVGRLEQTWDALAAASKQPAPQWARDQYAQALHIITDQEARIAQLQAAKPLN